MGIDNLTNMLGRFTAWQPKNGEAAGSRTGRLVGSVALALP